MLHGSSEVTRRSPRTAEVVKGGRKVIITVVDFLRPPSLTTTAARVSRIFRSLPPECGKTLVRSSHFEKSFKFNFGKETSLSSLPLLNAL